MYVHDYTITCTCTRIWSIKIFWLWVMVSTMMDILMYCSHELLTLEFLLQLGSGHDNDETLIGNHRYSTSVVTRACTVTSVVNMCCVIITGVLTYKAKLLRRKLFAVFIVVHSTTIFQWMYDCDNWKYKYISMLPQRISHKWPCSSLNLKVLPCTVDYAYCDQGEITGLVCTKYTHLYYSTYLNCCVSYSYKFSKWCWFTIVSYTSNKYFIARLYLGNKLLYFKFWKGSWLNFIYKPNFLMLGHI